MKVLSKFILVLTVGSVGLFASAPDTAWTKTYGGDGYDRGYSVQQTTDGGYIVAGSTESYGAGEEDVYLIKTNSLGDTLWTRTYGDTVEDRGYSVQQTTDGGYIVAGSTESYGAGGHDVYLIKTNGFGDTLWTRTYGGTGSDKGYSVQQTTDGGYIVAGNFNSRWPTWADIYLIKTNSLGDTLWTRTYGGEDSEYGFSVQQTSDGGYIIAGETDSYSAGRLDYDVYLIKTNSLGDTLWTRAYGDTTGNDDGRSVQQTSDGGYIVAGTTLSYDHYYDVYLIKTDSLGDTLWTRTYGRGSNDWGKSVQQTTDGGYIVAGSDFYLIKTNSLGDTLWTRTCWEQAAYFGYSVQQTTDGGYIVAGDVSDVCLMKIKPEEGGIEEEINTGLFSLSPADPNPFTNGTTVKYELSKRSDVDVSVYNMLGQKVRDLFSGKQSSGVHSVSWDGLGNSGGKLSSGIYLFKIEVGDKKASRKVTLVR